MNDRTPKCTNVRPAGIIYRGLKFEQDYIDTYRQQIDEVLLEDKAGEFGSSVPAALIKLISDGKIPPPVNRIKNRPSK
jgi:hypothetical protein